MTDRNKTLLAVVMDRSGSMEAIRDETISGFNVFLAEQQKQPGECALYYTQFDTQYEIVHKNIPISDMKPLDHSTFEPRGYTALYDAIGRTIHEVGIMLAERDEDQRPGAVIFVIQTDGMNNASREYNLASVSRMIKTQREQFNWQFIFLGASEESMQQGLAMGVSRDATMTYAGGQSVNAFAASASNVSRVRRSTRDLGAPLAAAFTKEEREKSNENSNPRRRSR